MISVGSRNGRKGVELRFGREEMEETELEEGEACYQNEDDDSSIDPDIALSYIDEKLQDVLGHFQKDFEGGVSAENLGAKFGGYGSFLPTYQRSPSWSHPRASPEVFNRVSRSPNNMHHEGGRPNSFSSSSVPLQVGPVVGHRMATLSGPRMPRLPSGNDEFQDIEEMASKLEVKKSSSFPDPKTLKFRIKVGTDNLSTRKNTEIYSGLGLDVSPSSSLDDSPTHSEGLYQSLDNQDLSPTSILQVMISIPFGGIMISPISGDVIHLCAKEQGLGRSKSKTVNKTSQGNSQMVVNGSDLKMSNGKVLSDKKAKSHEKSAVLVELSNNNSKENYDSNGTLASKKEIDINSLACEELVSSALKLPFLSNSYSDGAESDKIVINSKDAAKSRVANTSFSDVAEKEREQKAAFSDKPVSYISEERMNVDTSKQKALSSTGKKKSKVSQTLAAQNVEFPEDGPIINSSVVPKTKKISNSNGIMPKNNSEGLKKGDSKATDIYREVFGELDLEQEDDEIVSEQVPFKRRSKDNEFVEKRSTSESNSTLKEKHMGKTTEEQSVSGDHRRLSSNMPHHAGRAPNADAAPVAAPVVQEDWVCCDKCQAWRLLPLGTNPKSLPEKWVCSMLNWLPGMNHCSISEEETTNSLRALYQTQTSAAQSQPNQHAHPGGTSLGVASGDARRSSSQNSGLQPTASGGKKKSGSKDVRNATDQDSCAQVSDLKNFQESSKSRLNKLDLSRSIDEFAYQDEGDTMSSKTKNKRENEKEAMKASKKMKTEEIHSKDRNSDHAGAFSKVVRSSNSNFSNGASGRDPHSHSNRSRDSKGDMRKKSVTSEKLEVQMSITSDDGSLHNAKCGNDSLKKRKRNEHQKPKVSDLPLPIEGHNSQGSRGSLEESRECDPRKEKKARVSKSDGKDSNRSKNAMVAGKKAARALKDQQMRQDSSTPSRMSLDAPDSLRRDLGSAQPAVAATSSSSKVSGSHRSKASRGEMKGSPVESVSSSPLRISNTDKFSEARKNTVTSKDNLQDASLFAMTSPRRSINGGHAGGSDETGKLKDDSFNVIHNGSLETSVIDFQARDWVHVSNAKGKADCVSSPNFPDQAVPGSNTLPLDQDNQSTYQTETSEQSRDERKRNDNLYTSNGSQSKKSGKGFSSRSKEKTRGLRAGLDDSKIKDADSFDGSMYEEKMKAGKNKPAEKSENSSDRMEKSYVSKKDSAGKVNREISKEESHHNVGGARPDVISCQDPIQNVQQKLDNEKSSSKLVSEKTGVEDSGRVKSHSLQPSARGQSEATARTHATGESKKDKDQHAFEQDDALKVSKQSKKAEKQSGNQPVNLRKLTPTVQKGRDLDAPSPARKESSSQAVTTAVKEAKDLKHMADRLKNLGSTDSTGLYFQAALKFLHGASLLESSGTENSKHNERIQSMQIYSSTAKLCEFCAHEYEKSKDMAAAALAYKLVEVAYMRVIYSSHGNASRDRNELQAALQIIPTGESPSSSASDIDNLNNPATADKAVIPKGVASPQVAGNHVLTGRSRSSCMRLINFAQDVNFAMEASRKSRTRFGEAQSREGISSVKRALDFNFQDVDGLLHLVRVAMEAIAR